jgi:hypothetical protein
MLWPGLRSSLRLLNRGWCRARLCVPRDLLGYLSMTPFGHLRRTYRQSFSPIFPIDLNSPPDDDPVTAFALNAPGLCRSIVAHNSTCVRSVRMIQFQIYWVSALF